MDWTHTFGTHCINECDLNTHNCNNNAKCFNANGLFVCNCSDGFSGNGIICEGIQTINFFWVRSHSKRYEFDHRLWPIEFKI